MPRIIFAVSEEEKSLWVRAAHEEYVSLSEWLRRAAAARVGNGGLAAGEVTGGATDRGVEPQIPGGPVAEAKTHAASSRCSRWQRHHVNHSGKPCPECGFPKEEQ